MGNIIKWIGIALGLCVVLGVIVSIANGGKKTDTSALPATSVARSELVNTPNVVAPPATSAAPSSMPAAPNVALTQPTQVRPTRTAKPTQATATPVTTAAPGDSADLDAARQALLAHLDATVCAPGTTDDPRPLWCDHITSITLVPGGLISVVVTLTKDQESAFREVLSGIRTFTANNLYAKYGLKNSEVWITSESDGSRLESIYGKQPTFTSTS
jgi:hypothetical protein